MIPKLTAKQQAHFDKMPERNKETIRAFWASEAQIALGSCDAHFKATRSEIPSASSKVTKSLHPKTEERRTYIERYGKDAWEEAVTVAGRHRGRASKDFGLIEHFTAPQWLDLCAHTDFCCSACGVKAPLEPHHRTALATLGLNTISNIDPVCSPCHRLIPIPCQVSDVRAAWLAEQDALYLRHPPVGALVRQVRPWSPISLPWGAVTSQLGVVVGAEPARLAPGPLWGRFPDERRRSSDRGVYVLNDNFMIHSGVYPPVQPLHVAPQVHVRWAGAQEVTFEEVHGARVVDASVVKAEALKWLQEQNLLMTSWKVGDCVRSRHYSKRGVIEKVNPHKALALTGFAGEGGQPTLPSDWVPLSPASAHVRWLRADDTTRATRVGFNGLVLLDEDAAAPVRELMASCLKANKFMKMTMGVQQKR